MRWTWDPDKNAENKRKHRISFQTAMLVFRDPLFMTDINPYPYEERFQTLGMVNGDVILVIHTFNEAPFTTKTEAGRIISARKATPQERKTYEEGAF